jgi:large subunit ribosomal protein L29
LKSSELKGLTLPELQERLEQAGRSLYQHRVGATTKELENTSLIRQTKRDIARIKQMIAEKQRGEAAQPKAS